MRAPYRPVQVVAEEGSLVRPRRPAAVAAGNVETSQRIVDVLFLAMAEPLVDQVPAQSQGTMNNPTIGGLGPQPVSYHETTPGGAGRRPLPTAVPRVPTPITAP